MGHGLIHSLNKWRYNDDIARKQENRYADLCSNNAIHNKYNKNIAARLSLGCMA